MNIYQNKRLGRKGSGRNQKHSKKEREASLVSKRFIYSSKKEEDEEEGRKKPEKKTRGG